jgi:hypothetical protein
MAKDKNDTALSPDLELERLRLQNENLRLQKEILDKQNPPKPHEIEAKLEAERRAAQEQALHELEHGASDKPLPYKFRVHLPGNWPTSQPRSGEPHLVVGASIGGEHGMREAIARYNKHMHIISPPPGARYQVQQHGKPAVEVGNEAVAPIDVSAAADPAPAMQTVGA